MERLKRNGKVRVGARDRLEETGRAYTPLGIKYVGRENSCRF